jgi:hypothetical protein
MSPWRSWDHVSKSANTHRGVRVADSNLHLAQFMEFPWIPRPESLLEKGNYVL